MSTKEKQYIKGFNSGYLLAKHEPDLLAKVVNNINPTNDFIEGLISGKEEYEIEHARAQTEDLNRVRNQSKDQDRDLER